MGLVVGVVQPLTADEVGGTELTLRRNRDRPLGHGHGRMRWLLAPAGRRLTPRRGLTAGRSVVGVLRHGVGSLVPRAPVGEVARVAVA